MENPIGFLKKLIDAPLRIYLLVMGAVTGFGGLALAKFPQFVAGKLLVLPLTAGTEDYTPLVQHWGILLALVGWFMVAAAFKEEWQVPAMAISGVEKTCIAAFGWVIYQGELVTLPGLLLDTVGSVYTMAYFGGQLIEWWRRPRPEPLV